MSTDRDVFQSTTRVLLVTAVVLSIPLLAMLVTDEVAWDVVDFVVMGGLIAGVGLAYETARRVSSDLSYRAGLGLGLAAVFLLIWMNLAVGLIGSEDNPANAMYLAVLAVAPLGAILARLRPRGMALTMFAAAATLAAIAAIALIGQLGPAVQTIGVNGMFMVLFVGSGLLFRRAENQRRGAP